MYIINCSIKKENGTSEETYISIRKEEGEGGRREKTKEGDNTEEGGGIRLHVQYYCFSTSMVMIAGSSS